MELSLSSSSSDWSPCLSHSSSDWTAPAIPERFNADWEQWEENSNIQIDNQKNNSRDRSSSSDWSQKSLKGKHNGRWDNWELEDPDGHDDHPQNDESGNQFGKPRHSTISSDWSLPSSKQKLNYKWRHGGGSGFDNNSDGSQLSGDNDYIPPEDFRLRPGPSNDKAISTHPQNQNTQRIGMSTWYVVSFLHIILISMQFSTSSFESKVLGTCISRSRDSKAWIYCISNRTGFFFKLGITPQPIIWRLYKTVLLPFPGQH